MALRALKSFVFTVFFTVMLVLQAYSCFGPKLFVGVASGPENEVLYALVTLYVKEKTGVESTLVAVDKDIDPLDLIAKDKADLVFAAPGESLQDIVFEIENYPILVSGERPLEELQFTTVLPAVKKLNRLLKSEDVKALTDKVKEGESAMAVVREFFMEHRWI